MVYLAVGIGVAAEHTRCTDARSNMSINEFIQAFHFLRPWWLLTLPLLWFMVWWLARRRRRDGDWASVIDKELLPALRLDAASVGGMRPWPWLLLLWSIAALALAGPSWRHNQAPAFRAPADWIFVLDLSPSMAASDIAPNRLTRARFALDDLLGAAHDARVALVVFSDEAYTVTPLTQDVATVRALLPPLAPDIMPSPGDHLAPALKQARQLLQAGGQHDQRVVVLTDGFDDPAAAFAAAAALKAQGVTLSVVGIGTASGAPLQDADGHFAKDAQGHAVMTQLNVDQLQQLARSGGSAYVDVAQLPGLISYLQSAAHSSAGVAAAQGIEVSHWQDEGVWLLPVLLLLAGLLARRSWL
jgi:Ca-activated chloride channel family protein